MIYNVDSPGGAAERIRLRLVRKAFGDREVLRGVDLAVGPGEVLGLLGTNGAGKSTLIRIMTGLTRADSGEVTVGGVDARRSPGRLGGRVGLAPQDLALYPQLTARQNLEGFGAISGLSRRAARARADEVLELLGLTAQARQSAGSLSGGQKRRLHTGVAIMHRPPVLFLDEPTVGADVPSRAGVLELVRRMAADGATVVYTTHYLPEFERLGARIAVLHEGRIVVDGSLREVIDRFACPGVRLRFRGAAPKVQGWHAVGTTLVADQAMVDAGAALAAVLRDPGVDASDLVDVEVVLADLETAYLAIVGEPVGEGVDDVVRA